MDSTFQWELRHPHTESPSDRMPCAREAPGCILVYRDRLYMFGGGTLRYGRSAAQGNKANLGALNDLWRYDPETNGWEMLEPDDGATGFDPNAQRPRTRILPAWVEVADVFYLYGGLSILSKGWRHSHINDLWSYDPGQGRWEMLEPNDGTLLEHPDFTGPGRPATVAGFGTAVIGSEIYIFGGWGHHPPLPPTIKTAVLSRQLWYFDIRSRVWRNIPAAGDSSPAEWPAKRYVMAMTAWQGRLYIWGGRDTQDRDPQFYNDLWEFDPVDERWRRIQANRPGAQDQPSARYGVGSVLLGDRWYVFGGFGPDGEFLPEEVNGPQLNDLWCFELRRKTWECIQPHDGSKDYSEAAERPGVRRVPGTVSHANRIYLFGGIDLASGPNDDGPVVGFNDLWCGTNRPSS